MRLTKQRVVLFLLLAFIATISLIIAQDTGSKDEFVVEGLTVSDVPADDGTGLVISWKPLHRSKRIIEYRIYRGISEDQLFFHGSIPVNVKTGVAADTMYYYDSSWNDFIDIRSPGKLRKEVKQAENSPLYRKIPRDVELAAELSSKYTILSMIPKNEYYYRTKKSFSSDEADSTAYAGLHLRQQTLLAKLKPGETYYYTIVAVDEKSTYHPHAPIASGSPMDNPPDPATDFYSVLLEDSLKMQFEWEYPLFSDDLYTWKIFMMPPLPNGDWDAKRASGDLSGLDMRPIAVEQVNSFAADTAKNYTILDLQSLLQEGISLEKFKNSAYVLELMDYSGNLSYTRQSRPRLLGSDALPPKPEYRVEDKPNDKGDRLTVIWDHPIVFVTQTSLEGKDGKKLRVNYQLNATETQEVFNIYFDFFRAGETEPFVSINEFYQDEKIFLTIPADYDYRNGFRVRMTLKAAPETPADYVLEQDLEWDIQMLTLMPGKKLYRNGIEVSALGNVVYRKRTNTPFYASIKKNTSFDNNLDVSIPYETNIFRVVNGFNYIQGDSLISVMGGKRYSRALDSKTPTANLALVSADIDLIFDKDNGRTIMTSIYRDEALKQYQQRLDDANAKLAELQSSKAELGENPTGAENVERLASLETEIGRTESMIALLTNEHLQIANEIESSRGRMRYVARTREEDKRKQSFLVVRTDGRGLFTVGDPQVDADGNTIYMLPISNWFDTNKVVTLFATIIFTITVFTFISLSKRGKDLYIRPIAGLAEIDNAIGRATEMGRPMLFCTGAGGLSDVATLASLGILGLVAKRAAEYDTKLIVPCYDYMVMPIAQEIVREAHYEVGRPDSYDKNNIFYLTNVQFAYVAGVNGIMIRERMATNFFMGFFAAEALLMTETGNFIGAVQIAGTDAITQIPFFITTCDYTLIGEELYAASAYLNREPMLLGTLKGQDYYKFLILSFILVGAIFATFQLTFITRLFPTK